MVRFPASRVTHAPGPLLITSHRKTSSASGSLKWQALGPAIVHQACGLLLRDSTQPSDAYFKSDAYFNMATSIPMEDYNPFIGSIIEIDYHFLDQDSCEPLFGACIGTGRVACDRQNHELGHQMPPDRC
jgi:hypothetical protein